MKPEYNLERIRATLERLDSHFVISGGEPLLAPKPLLEELWEWGYDKFGRNGLQTNGLLLDADHVEMFKKYNVAVSLSFDGPGELNRLRTGDDEKAAEKIEQNVRSLVENPTVSTGVLITLNRANAGTEEKLARLKKFLLYLAENGQTGGDILTLINANDPGGESGFLPPGRRSEKFLSLAEFMEEHGKLDWGPFEEIKRALRDPGNVGLCTFDKCDPFTTKSLTAVDSAGSVHSCTCLTPEGFPWQKAPETFHERYINLYQTPQSSGGCKGCRFFILCGGGCPAGSINGDWRNKTRNCPVYKKLFKYYEDLLERKKLTPFSRREDREEVEKEIIENWEKSETNPWKAPLTEPASPR